MDKKFLMNDGFHTSLPEFKKTYILLKKGRKCTCENINKPGKKDFLLIFTPHFWALSVYSSKYVGIVYSKLVVIRDERAVKNRSSSEVAWYQYVLYLHILILYILLFSVYSELRVTKETMYTFHMNMINISMKGMEVEKNCLSEISNFRSTLRLNEPLRVKRDVLETLTFSASISGKDAGLESSYSSEEAVPRSRTQRKVHSQRRGKKHKGKNKRRCHSKHACGYPRATHFIGALPEPIIRDGGSLAPWFVDKDAVRDFSLNTKVPFRGRDAIEVTESGLYFIYSQVYYMSPNDSSKSHSSFSIMMEKKSGAGVMLAQCASLGDSSVGGEASCFTATAQSLVAGDLVYIKQRERDRHVIMKKGQTFLGLILLNKRSSDKTAQQTDMLPVSRLQHD